MHDGSTASRAKRRNSSCARDSSAARAEFPIPFTKKIAVCGVSHALTLLGENKYPNSTNAVITNGETYLVITRRSRNLIVVFASNQQGAKQSRVRFHLINLATADCPFRLMPISFVSNRPWSAFLSRWRNTYPHILHNRRSYGRRTFSWTPRRCQTDAHADASVNLLWRLYIMCHFVYLPGCRRKVFLPTCRSLCSGLLRRPALKFIS